MTKFHIRAGGEDGERVLFIAAQQDTEQRVHVFLVGNGAFDSDASIGREQLTLFAKRAARHLGNRHLPLYLMHLGASQQPVYLGGPNDVSMQRSDLDAFIEAAIACQGAFGSWWDTSFGHIRGIAGRKNGFPLTISLFQENSAVEPLQWDRTALAAWLADRQRMWGRNLIDRIRIVTRREAQSCFADIQGVECIGLSQWLIESPDHLSEAQILEVEIADESGDAIPRPEWYDTDIVFVGPPIGNKRKFSIDLSNAKIDASRDLARIRNVRSPLESWKIIRDETRA